MTVTSKSSDYKTNIKSLEKQLQQENSKKKLEKETHPSTLLLNPVGQIVGHVRPGGIHDLVDCPCHTVLYTVPCQPTGKSVDRYDTTPVVMSIDEHFVHDTRKTFTCFSGIFCDRQPPDHARKDDLVPPRKFLDSTADRLCVTVTGTAVRRLREIAYDVTR